MRFSVCVNAVSSRLPFTFHLSFFSLFSPLWLSNYNFLPKYLQILFFFRIFVAVLEDAIRHNGIVERVDGDLAIVRIVQTSACAACHAAGMCMASESREKIIEAQMLEPLHVGDNVEVLVREQAGWLAVCLAYVVPFVLLVAFVAAFDYLGWSEAKAGTAALVSVAVYYGVLRLFRDKLQRKFTFWAKKVG